ncbi:MAG TPA: CBS domain-containing protein [Nitrospiria bacterium]|jgi:CBS domain-containing protein
MLGKDFKKGDNTFQELTADALMQTDPVNYDQNVSCQAIASALVLKRSGAITIVDDARKPVGIVTEYDLLRAIKEGKDLNEITPQAIMTQPIVISEKSLVSEILDTLVTGHIIHLPVVDFQEKLIGLIERQDILSAYLKYQK